MRDFLECMSFIGILCIVVIGVVVGTAMAVNSYDCSNYGEMKGLKTETRFLTCYVTAQDGQVFTRVEYQSRITGSKIVLGADQ